MDPLKTDAPFTVVFVDDDTDFLDALRVNMRGQTDHWDCVFFDQPGAALEHLSSVEHAVLISDWMMPEMNGLQLCQAIEKGIADQSLPDVYVILLTGRAPSNNAAEALQSGANDFVCKPIETSNF